MDKIKAMVIIDVVLIISCVIFVLTGHDYWAVTFIIISALNNSTTKL